MATDSKPYLTVEQYLTFERTSEYRHEYEQGYLSPMEAATPNHARITSILARQVGNQIQQNADGCLVYSKDLHVLAGPRYAYPDLVVTCGKEEFLRAAREMDLLLNPILLGEVLSPSTEDFDRGGKFARYREIQSFREYLIVFQDRLLVEQHIRQPDGWFMHQHKDPLNSFPLVSVPAEIQLGELYAGVDWLA